MKALVVALTILTAAPALSVQPDEVLADPAAEARAREISAGLRCLVCRNESIDDSNAELARTLRLLVRERITAGDDDEQVIDYVVDRYGEYVLLQPRFSLGNAFIWLSGPVLLGVGGWLAWRQFRRSESRRPEPLTTEERKRLEALLGER
jgi:cytochrome c-type biogenesis protein CcmH